MHEKDDLDLLLDSALATYADPGREAGLEQRMLAALATAQSLGVPGGIFARSRRWMPWAIALSAAASLLVWISIANVKHVPSVETGAAPWAQRAPSESHVPAEQPDALKAHDLSPAKKTAKSMRASAPGGRIFESPPAQNSARLPKLNTFPTPQPLTAEEQALLAVVTHASAAQREALLEAQKPLDDPLSVAALNIPPLAVPDAEK